MNKQQLYCLQANSWRDLVSQVNSLGITKEDVLHLTREEGLIFLLYYG